MDLTLVPYQHNSNSNSNSKSQSPIFLNVKYKECLKNHAASLGGHAHDGCGEFMPPSDLHSFTCAACGCHRNFHRRDPPSSQHLLLPPPPPPHHHQKQLFIYNAGVSPVNKRPDHEFDDDDDGGGGDDDHDRRSETPEREDRMSMDFGGGGAAAAAAAEKRKRFRTKFTAEQKEKMLDFAEKIGWRISKHDDVALNQFCNEIGVKRNVLKVWMHNNKNAHHRRGDPTLPPPPSYAVASAAAPPPSVGPAPQSVGV